MTQTFCHFMCHMTNLLEPIAEGLRGGKINFNPNNFENSFEHFASFYPKNL